MTHFYRPVLHGSKVVETTLAGIARISAENSRAVAAVADLKERLDVIERTRSAEAEAKINA